MPRDINQYDFLVNEIALVQTRLIAFIRIFIHDRDIARDILQEVNLALWQKRREFDVTRNFGSWACGVARYEVMAYLRDRSRDKHVYYNELLLEQVADQAEKGTFEIDQRITALHNKHYNVSSNPSSSMRRNCENAARK